MKANCNEEDDGIEVIVLAEGRIQSRSRETKREQERGNYLEVAKDEEIKKVEVKEKGNEEGNE